MNWEAASQRERASGPYDPHLRVAREAQWERGSQGNRLSPGKVTAETLALDWARLRKRTKEERREFERELRRHPAVLRLPKKDLMSSLVRADSVADLARTATERNRRRLAERAAKRTGRPASSLESLKEQAAAQGLTLQQMSARTKVAPPPKRKKSTSSKPSARSQRPRRKPKKRQR